MTKEEFDKLDEETQSSIIYESEKISEMRNAFIMFQLFYIDNLFIETKTSVTNRLKRWITTFTLNDLPLYYAGTVQASFNSGKL